MKKFLMMLLAALLVIGMFSVAALADTEFSDSNDIADDALDTPVEDYCPHPSTYETIAQYPTCEETGTIDIVCLICKEVVEKKAIDNLGHEMDLVSEVAPTCTENGNKHYECANPGCKKTEDVAIKAPGHVWKFIRVVEEPTCYKDGYQLEKCLACEEYQTVTLKKFDHKFADGTSAIHGLETIPATCTKAGKEVTECAICLDTFTKVLDALGHDWSKWNIDEVPSCTQAGLKSRYCMRECCYEANLLNTVKETEVIAAHGHKVMVGTETPATCTTAGTIAGLCVYCSEEVVATTAPATGHTFGEWVVTTEPAVGVEGEETRTCAACGATETRAIAALEGEDKPAEEEKEEDKPATKPETDKSESVENGDVVIPATGDNTTVAPYIMMMLAAAGLVVLAVSKRKVNG